MNDRIRELFNTLDCDKDGVISSDKIDFSQLSSGILDILTQFLVRLEESKKAMDFQEFKLQIQENIKVSINSMNAIEFEFNKKGRTVWAEAQNKSNFA